MNDQSGKSSNQTLAAGLLGFAVVVVLGGLLILRHGGESTDAPVVAYAPVDADSGLRAPSRPASNAAAPAAAGSAASSPAPLLSDDARDDGASPAASAASAGSVDSRAAAGSGSSAAKLGAASPLDGPASASSSASVAVSTAAPKAKSAVAGGKKPFAAPKLDLSKNQGTIASTVHYGVSDRAELMGRAAGPVYNFAGKGAGQARSGQVAADNAAADTSGAMRQIDAAKKEIDGSGAPTDEKTKLDQNLDQVRQTADSAAAGQ